MRVIVCGGRFEDLSKEDEEYLIKKVKDGTITTLVCGMADGIDMQSHDLLKPLIPIDPYPALWDDLTAEPCLIKYNKYGKPYNALSGPNRNKLMSENADGVIAFSGGIGTDNMIKQAKKAGLVIINDFREVLY